MTAKEEAKYCHVCCRSSSKALDSAAEMIQNEMAIITASFGYGSKHDGEMYKAYVCEGCFFEKIRPLLRLNPYVGNYMFTEKEHEGFEDSEKEENE